MPPGGLDVAVQADPDADAELLQRVEHARAQQGAVGLNADVDLSRDPGAQRPGQLGQPSGAGQQRLAAVQDHLDAG